MLLFVLKNRDTFFSSNGICHGHVAITERRARELSQIFPPCPASYDMQQTVYTTESLLLSIYKKMAVQIVV
ncbi:unnamed protein product [Calypogeia fissa]